VIVFTALYFGRTRSFVDSVAMEKTDWRKIAGPATNYFWQGETPLSRLCQGTAICMIAAP
jgi:hypothetical protein